MVQFDWPFGPRLFCNTKWMTDMVHSLEGPSTVTRVGGRSGKWQLVLEGPTWLPKWIAVLARIVIVRTSPIEITL